MMLYSFPLLGMTAHVLVARLVAKSTNIAHTSPVNLRGISSSLVILAEPQFKIKERERG